MFTNNSLQRRVRHSKEIQEKGGYMEPFWILRSNIALIAA